MGRYHRFQLLPTSVCAEKIENNQSLERYKSWGNLECGDCFHFSRYLIRYAYHHSIHDTHEIWKLDNLNHSNMWFWEQCQGRRLGENVPKWLICFIDIQASHRFRQVKYLLLHCATGRVCLQVQTNQSWFVICLSFVESNKTSYPIHLAKKKFSHY